MSILKLLEQDVVGQVVLANLWGALKEGLVPLALVHSFLDAHNGTAPSKSPVSRAHAENIVFGNPKDFQMQGPASSPQAGARYLNIQPLTRWHKTLADLYDATRSRTTASDEERFKDAVDIRVAFPNQPAGRSDRLLWLALLDDQLQDELLSIVPRVADGLIVREPTASNALALLFKRFGVRFERRTPYILSCFENSSVDKSKRSIQLFRPTVFDGVDGDYFKQLHLSGGPATHGSTADLRSIPNAISDGVKEVVTLPPPLARIIWQAVVYSPDEPDSSNPSDFAAALSAKMAPRLNWSRSASEITGMLHP